MFLIDIKNKKETLKSFISIIFTFILIFYINNLYFLIDCRIPLYIIIIGYIIFKFRFNSKIIVNIMLLCVTILLAPMTVFPYPPFILIILFMLLVIFLILMNNYLKGKNKSLCIVITLIALAELYTAYNYGKLYGDVLYKYYLWIFTYLLFFTIQDKNIEYCINIRGILSIVVTFIIFYFINNEEWIYLIIEKINKLNINKIIFYLYDFLEILSNIFIFITIKNLKK